MKTKTLSVIGLGLLLVLVLAACAPQAEVEPTAAPQPAAPVEQPTQAPAVQEEQAAQAPTAEEPMTVEQPQPAAAIDVEALIIEKVDGKHDVQRIFNATKTREEWEKTIDRMIGYGAKINAEEKQIIIDYLLSR
jgi:PBP1b-binding outer membrane lipoprotein LpoB